MNFVQAAESVQKSAHMEQLNELSSIFIWYTQGNF